MNKTSLKKVVISCLFLTLGILYFPVAFSTSHHLMTGLFHTNKSSNKTLFSNSDLSIVYDSLNLEAKGLSEDAFTEAVEGYNILVEQGKIKNPQVLSIADFSKPSSQKRLFVIDIKTERLLYNTYVAHGQNSGREMAENFSNKPESYQSSLGFYITSETYNGKNGYSLKLEGVEKGINDMAYSRAIVMHGAPYVSESFVRSNGYLGRSWGCPAVPQELNKPIINSIKGGSCLFIFSNDNNYKLRSKLV